MQHLCGTVAAHCCVFRRWPALRRMPPPLKLASSTPVANALAVERASDLLLVFDGNVASGSVDSATVQLSGDQGMPSTFSANPM